MKAVSSLGASGLPKLIRQECDQHLMSGHLDDAVLTALKWVDKRIALAAGNPPAFGVAAVNRVFGEPKGTIRLASDGERRGTADLLRGLMTLYRNPSAHGFPDIQLEEARAVVDLADALLARIGRGIARAAGAALAVEVAEVVELAVADLDGDKANETVVAVLNKAGSVRLIGVLKSESHGYLARTVVDDCESVFGVEARDVDGDGRAEVLIYSGAGGPGAWLDVLRWDRGATTRIQRISADLAQFTWSQPDGDGAWMLSVQGRSYAPDHTMLREYRTYRWGAGQLEEAERRSGPWT